MFSQNLGTRSIKDFNYIKHANGAMINLRIANKLSNDELPQLKEDKQFRSINLNNRLDDSILEQVEIDDNLANELMMQDENMEVHQMLNFEQGQLKMKTLESKRGGGEKTEFGKGMERSGAESKMAIKNRQITPNPFYHA